MEEVEYLDGVIRRWQIGGSSFLAWPERGARLMNWNISYADGTLRDIISWPEITDGSQFVKARGGNPILFPFCARTFDNGIIHYWKDESGTSRPMPMHGFARQGSFEIARIDATGFMARLQPDHKAKQSYPFEYDFDVVYRFEEKALTVELRLRNRDKRAIPWSPGHHFYFALPWVEGTSRQHYTVSIPANKACRHAADGSLYHVTSFRTEDSLANPELIDRIHYDLNEPTISCECLGDDSKVEIDVGTSKHPDPGYALVTWTEADDSPFFCIEPWMGPPNSPEHKIGLHTVNPGETEAFSVTVRI